MDLGTLELKIARSENLPVLPQVVSSVLKLADDPDASPRAMERIVERDPAITAKILRVANSPFYGGNKISSIGRAISMLGLNSVRSLVVGVAYQQVMSGKPTSVKFNKLEFWRHSLATATAARIIGKLRMPNKSEELFGAAMLHDVGFLVMDKFAPALLDECIKVSQRDGIPMYKAEQAVCSFDHTQLGELLAIRWGMSDIIRAAIRYHHEPFKDANFEETTSIIAAANALAYDIGCTNHTQVAGCMMSSEELLDMVGVPEGQISAIRGVVVAEVARAEEAFMIK